MHETKCILIDHHGLKCMLCKCETQLRKLQWHHIKPKYQSKREGQEPDNSYANGSLLCDTCHRKIHKFDWYSNEYQEFVAIILVNKQATFK